MAKITILLPNCKNITRTPRYHQCGNFGYVVVTYKKKEYTVQQMDDGHLRLHFRLNNGPEYILYPNDRLRMNGTPQHLKSILWKNWIELEN